MSEQTPTLDLTKSAGGEAVEVRILNENWDKVDEFAKEWGRAIDRNQQFYGPASAIGSLTGVKRGDTYQELDGDFLKLTFDGNAWKNEMTSVFQVFRAAAQNIPVNAWTDVLFTGAAAPLVSTYNPITFDAATGIATVKHAGLYEVSGHVTWGAGASGSAGMGIAKVATAGTAPEHTTLDVLSTFGSQQLTTLVRLAANETLRLRVITGVAKPIYVVGANYDTVFAINRVGA